eukprot:TRINITY_DN10093_c0_g1_i2.p1 TRINITY_DN10093_c0_g1~~TRINITY_DN10093_c0_g1_i2.p1  ORF type:complete len:537 (-),score=45.35 TRINITY_DN10093_c0_g1_i2:212-1822(-)
MPEQLSRMIDAYAVLLEKDDGRRSAIADTLVEFGFKSDRVYGFCQIGETIEKMEHLNGQISSAQSDAVVAFIPCSDVAALSQKRLRVLFVVSVSESVQSVILANVQEQCSCNCVAPTNLDRTTLGSCAELFSDWLKAEQAKDLRTKKFYEAAERNRKARAKKAADAAANTSIAYPVAAKQPVAETSLFEADTLAFPSQIDEKVATVCDKPTPYVDLGMVLHTGLTPTVLQPESSNGSVMSSVSTRRNNLDSLALLLPGRSPFDDVRIDVLAGSGSFGSVYKARWHASTVALKVIKKDGLMDSESATFEGSLASSLAHPNLVQTFKHSIRCTDDSRRDWEVWIVQEWCGLGTLGDTTTTTKILNQGGFPCIAEVGCEISSALTYLHSRGIVHGDLSGNNVLLGLSPSPKGFAAKVADFGMARVLGSEKAHETKSMGTISSMPPEVFVKTGATLTAKVDVYAFGILLWMLSTGKPPYAGMAPPQIVVAVARGRLLEFPPAAPAQFAEMYKSCVQREATARPSFDDLIASFLSILTGYS